jgi:hypothetical protein
MYFGYHFGYWQTKVTPLVEGYGGYGLRMEVVPIESAYPEFGELLLRLFPRHLM